MFTLTLGTATDTEAHWNAAAYGQDTWKVREDLTLNLGVPADAEIERQIFTDLPGVLAVCGGVPVGFGVRSRAEGQGKHVGIGRRVVDIERLVRGEVPSPVLRRVDVHE